MRVVNDSIAGWLLFLSILQILASHDHFRFPQQATATHFTALSGAAHFILPGAGLALSPTLSGVDPSHEYCARVQQLVHTSPKAHRPCYTT